jgi:hypothetical protein
MEWIIVFIMPLSICAFVLSARSFFIDRRVIRDLKYDVRRLEDELYELDNSAVAYRSNCLPSTSADNIWR